MSSGNSNIPSGAVAGAIPNVGSNSAGFTTGMGPIDPNQGLNSLGGPLMGANAGTLPNGFIAGNGAPGASSNYVTPQGQGTGGGSGMSSGALNGNSSFTMPNNSMPQLNAQKLGAGMAAGAKLANAPASGNAPPSGRGGTVHMSAQNFSAPMVDFAGSTSGSQAGNSLISLLSKYKPGAAT
jgi:hypothetical protein